MSILSWIKGLFSSSTDRKLTCVQCNKTFAFESGEQEFYKKKGLQEPKRCTNCRKISRRPRGRSRAGAGGGRRGRR